MDTLLLLGIIPGTNIQIDFNDWLRFVASLLLIVSALRVIRHRHTIAVHLHALLASRIKPAARLA